MRRDPNTAEGVDCEVKSAATQADQSGLRAEQRQAAAFVLQGVGFADQGRLEEAADCYRRAISLCTDLAEAHHRLGMVLLKSTQYDEAVQSFRNDINLQPDYSKSYYHLREALEGQRKLASATRDYEKAVALHGHAAETNYRLGRVLAQQRRFAEATASYLRALKLDPHQELTHYELGNVLLSQGKYDEAIESYRQAISLKPDFALAYSQLAHVLALQGKTAEAAHNDKQALVITSRPPLKDCPCPGEISAALNLHPTSVSGDERKDGGALPIVVFYRELYLDPTLSALLPYCLAQAKKYNPRSEVILLGDSTHYYEFAEHAYILDYYTGAEEFSKVYKHVARNVRLDYMLFCFQRWFILKEFMEANGLKRCLHIDPDVMLFTDVTQASRRFSRFDFALSAHPDFGVCGHYNFINKLEALERYCGFIYDIFAHPPAAGSKPSPMKEAVWLTSTGYITDMTGFFEFGQHGLGRIGNLSRVSNDAVWDADIGQSHGFEMCRGLKNIYWKGEKAYCKQLRTGKEIRYQALHFCARSKKFMRNAFLKRPIWLED